MDITTNTPEPTIPTNTPEPTTPTKRRHRRTRPPGESIYGSVKSSNQDEKEPGPDVAPGSVRATTQTTPAGFRVSPKRLNTLAANIAGTYATVGVFVSARNQYDGLAIIACAEPRANELARALSHNKRLFELAERVFAQGDVMKAVIGHG